MLKNPQGATALVCPSSLLKVLKDCPLVCVEIGLAEIERAAGVGAGQIYAGELTAITAKAMGNRPEHLADILLVSSWMLVESICSDAQRDDFRQHWLDIAQQIENTLC
ncbi:MAG: hypothetical protein PHQ60_02080 [Sideroxydans sp.]|nr:hypothetical protein [Sideroxydans sp.]MDD5056631.1 hypothetical protein [Sideroxydans sp.]